VQVAGDPSPLVRRGVDRALQQLLAIAAASAQSPGQGSREWKSSAAISAGRKASQMSRALEATELNRW
jgi:hypothetical protein